MRTTAVWLKATALWLVILILAMANGVVREYVLLPGLGSFSAFVVSGMALSAIVFLVAYAAVPWYGKLAPFQWLLIGLFWLFMTLAFEFGFGRFLQQRAWSELLEAYRFEGGNLWPVVLVVIAFSPWLAAKWRGVI